jgi:ribulose kinase
VRALQETEAGWRQAINKIAQRAGLTQGTVVVHFVVDAFHTSEV